MADAESPLREVFLRPGEFSFGTGRLRISTLLGSCISIILWHPVRMHGGMCHYVLPSRGVEEINSTPDGRYADEAMLMFMRELSQYGTRPGEYRVSLYGGGAYLDASHGRMSIGDRNIAEAYRLLKMQGFQVAGEHVGNKGYRKIEFDVWDGRVHHEYISYGRLLE